MRTLPLLTLLVFLSFACSQTRHNDFTINGLTDLPDGSKVYLVEHSFLKERGDFDSKTIDSTTVSNGEFTFKGKLFTAYAHMQIHGEDHYRYIYVVNSPMTFDARGTTFNNAKVSGSAIQDQANKYAALDNVYENKLDSVETLAMDVKPEDSLGRIFMTAHMDIETAQYAATANLIRANPDYDLSSYWLMGLQESVAEETTKELYEGLSERVKQNVYSWVVLEHIQKSLKLEVGSQAPDIILADSTGKEIKLSAFRGKYVLVDFWSSMCGPCRVENTHFGKIYNMYKDRGFEVLSVSVDLNESSWKKAMKKDGVFWPSVWDSKRKFDRLYDVDSLPTTYLVDPNGVIIDKYLRGSALPKKLDELLKTGKANV